MTTNWDAEGARLSIFLLGTGEVGFDSLESVLGAPPDQTVKRGSETIEVGSHGQYSVRMDTSTHRHDLYLSPGLQAMTSPEVATIGKPRAAIEALTKLASKWVTKPADVKRVAVGLTGGHSAKTLEDALKLLIEKVPAFHPGGSPIRELEIRLNRPSPSGVLGGIELNRLCRWQIAQMQLIQLQNTGAVLSTPVTAIRAQVEIDINTPPEGPLIKADALFDLINELGSLAIESIEKGDAG